MDRLERPRPHVRDYVLRGTLGRGGSATVYEATDIRTGGIVAVKVLEAGPASDTQRLLREARLTASLDHDGIVRTLDAGLTEDGRAFLVMERLVGRTLADRLEECFWLPIEEALDVAAQLLDALGAAHDAGVIHRDVKPTNVFLVEEGPSSATRSEAPRVKLIDFGIGVDLGDPTSRVTEPDVVLGTVGYMAPEQLFGDPPTVRSDLYALGATLYEMLGGRRPLPIEGPDVPSILRAMSATVTPIASLRPALPATLASGIMRSLAKRAADRHACCREMRDACGLAPERPTIH